MADDLKTFVQKKMPSSTILADIINTIICDSGSYWPRNNVNHIYRGVAQIKTDTGLKAWMEIREKDEQKTLHELNIKENQIIKLKPRL